ncbi:MAG: peptide chain release factor N(5)-glutamine methyltransferase [bacterium]
MIVREALLKAIPTLPKSSPRLDAEVLLSFVIKKPIEYLLTDPEHQLSTSQIKKYNDLTARRAKYEPVAYLIGNQEFYGLDFIVNKHVLIPRPETELIIDEILKLTGINRSIIDLGTGSGCIIITLAKLGKAKQYIGIDISSPALAVAKKNAKLNQVDKKISFIKGNLLELIILGKEKIKNNQLIITANLPYLDQDMKNLLKSSDSAGLKYEPVIALRGGRDGLKYYRELARQIKKLKKLDPKLEITIYCEIGHTQTKEFKKIFTIAKQIKVQKDLAGLNRLAIVYL